MPRLEAPNHSGKASPTPSETEKCALCPATFPRGASKRRHMRIAHPETIRKSPVARTPKQSTDVAAPPTEGEEWVACGACSHAVRSRGELIRHVEQEHIRSTEPEQQVFRATGLSRLDANLTKAALKQTSKGCPWMEHMYVDRTVNRCKGLVGRTYVQCIAGVKVKVQKLCPATVIVEPSSGAYELLAYWRHVGHDAISFTSGYGIAGNAVPSRASTARRVKAALETVLSQLNNLTDNELNALLLKAEELEQLTCNVEPKLEPIEEIMLPGVTPDPPPSKKRKLDPNIKSVADKAVDDALKNYIKAKNPVIQLEPLDKSMQAASPKIVSTFSLKDEEELDSFFDDVERLVNDGKSFDAAENRNKLGKAVVEKNGVKTDQKTSSKSKVEPKVELKSTVEPTVDLKLKAEKGDPKSKAESKGDPKSKVEPRVDPKSKIVTKPEPKVELKEDPVPQTENINDPKREEQAADVKTPQNLGMATRTRKYDEINVQTPPKTIEPWKSSNFNDTFKDFISKEFHTLSDQKKRKSKNSAENTLSKSLSLEITPEGINQSDNRLPENVKQSVKIKTRSRPSSQLKSLGTIKYIDENDILNKHPQIAASLNNIQNEPFSPSSVPKAKRLLKRESINIETPLTRTKKLLQKEQVVNIQTPPSKTKKIPEKDTDVSIQTPPSKTKKVLEKEQTFQTPPSKTKKIPEKEQVGFIQTQPSKTKKIPEKEQVGFIQTPPSKTKKIPEKEQTVAIQTPPSKTKKIPEKEQTGTIQAPLSKTKKIPEKGQVGTIQTPPSKTKKKPVNETFITKMIDKTIIGSILNAAAPKSRRNTIAVVPEKSKVKTGLKTKGPITKPKKKPKITVNMKFAAKKLALKTATRRSVTFGDEMHTSFERETAKIVDKVKNEEFIVKERENDVNILIIRM